MSITTIVTLAVTLIIAVGGWVVAHWLTSRREIEQKKRDIRVHYLREAYLAIANLCDRGKFPDDIAQLQDAFNDIQLFGDPHQVHMVGAIVTALDQGADGCFNELLRALRNEIRGHIGLGPIEEDRWHIRAKGAGTAQGR